MLNWLNATAVQLWHTNVSRAEVLGDLTGLLAVWWAARENVWNWPVGNVNSALFFLLFIDARLYANAVLQVAFIALGFYGWWAWTHSRRQNTMDRPVRRTHASEWVWFVAIGAPAIALWTVWLNHNTDSPAPLFDSLALVLSLLATYGQAKKLLESWWIWIAVDAISVPLYASQHLYPTSALFVLFAGLCVIGLRDWTAALIQPTPVPVLGDLVP